MLCTSSELEKTAIETYKITKKICSQGTALFSYLRTSRIKKKKIFLEEIFAYY